MTGDGGVMTSLEDMAGWDRGLATGKLVKPETLALAFTPGKLDNGKPHTYGFGWVVGGTKGHRVVGHEGGWVGYRTFIRRYLDDRLTVVVLANNESLDVGSLGDQVAKLYLPVANHPKAR
jgi:CubicO group peptidase (beta-lactamase class C family)